MLNAYIEEAFATSGFDKKKMKAVAVSCGPGSYTGLRIGVSTAKGLCYGLGIPLIAINTLTLMAHTAIKASSDAEGFLFCPMIDARRMEVYAAIYRGDGSLCREASADIICSDSYGEFLSAKPVCFFGNGAEKCKTVLTHFNAHFIDEIVPLAENMDELARKKYDSGEVEDLAYFEPFYLKEFRATVPKKLI